MHFGSEKGGLQTFFRWTFYVFIAWFPFMFYEGYLFNGTSTRAINLLIFVEVLAIVLGLALLGRDRLTKVISPVTIALAVLLLSLIVSSFLGVDFSTSFWSKATRTTGLLYFLHIALFYLFFWMVFSDRTRMRQFLKVFLVSSGILSLATVLGQEGLKLIFSAHPMPGFTIGNSTFAGMYFYVSFMFAVYFIATQPKAKRRWWKNLLPAVFVISPYLLNFDLWRGNVDILKNPADIVGSAQASSVTILFSVGVLFIFWLLSKLQSSQIRKTLLFTGFGVAVVLLGLGARSLVTEGGVVQRAYLAHSTATRPIVWGFSKKAIADRPAFGWGVDNFDRAFQQYYDNRILEQKNGGEAYLDRAHNIFIDQALETGYIGLIIYILVYLTLFGCLLYTIVKSVDRHDQVLASVLLVYFFGHLLELQTAFDTTVTYVPLAFAAAITGILYANTKTTSKPITIPRWLQYTGGSLLALFGLAMFIFAAVPFAVAQHANNAIRNARSSEKRMPLYKPLFSTPIDKKAFLSRTSADLQKGVSLDPKVLDDPKKRAGIAEEFKTVTASYEEYVASHPDDYRAHTDLAELYIYLRLFDIDRLDDAHAVLDEAIALVPQAPQAYWLQSVAYLYQHKFELAKSWANRAYNLNPEIEESSRLARYLEKSMHDFPVIDLYAFRQI